MVGFRRGRIKPGTDWPEPEPARAADTSVPNRTGTGMLLGRFGLMSSRTENQRFPVSNRLLFFFLMGHLAQRSNSHKCFFWSPGPRPTWVSRRAWAPSWPGPAGPPGPHFFGVGFLSPTPTVQHWTVGVSQRSNERWPL